MHFRDLTVGSSVVAIATGVAMSCAHAASDELVAAANKEGAVTWYTSMIVDQAARPLAEAFSRKYPDIDLQFSRAGGADSALKIINEASAGRIMGDVFDSVSAYTALRAADLVSPYKAEAAAAIPDDYKDPEGYWTAPNVYYLSAAHNTDLVSDEEAPRTYADLLDPKWKDQIVWSVVPQESGAPGFIGNILMTMGEKDGMAYLEKLAGQDITNMETSQRTVLDRVILGDFSIGLMTYTHHSPISAADGAPVDWLKIEPVIASPNTMGLVKGSPHPNAGKLLIDFILSEEGQAILSEGMYLPTNPNVAAKVPELMADGPEPFATTLMSPEVVTPRIGRWIEIETDLFR